MSNAADTRQAGLIMKIRAPLPMAAVRHRECVRAAVRYVELVMLVSVGEDSASCVGPHIVAIKLPCKGLIALLISIVIP